MMASILVAALAGSLLSPVAAAASATTCNPTTATATCAPIPAMPSSVTYDLSTTDTADFQYVMSDRIAASGSGLTFSVDAQGDAPTIVTNDYLLYGNVKATVQSAPGVGMVSAFILMSDVLDEVDLEWLGAYDDEVQTNYYYRGETAGYDRGGVSNVTTPENVSHVYEIDWTSSTLRWIVDGVTVRTLNQADTTAYGYPNTPCQIKIGVWASGDPSNAAGTISWGGGLIDYSAGPYTMTLSSLEVTSYTTAKSFSYSSNGTSVVISQDAISSSSSSPSSSSTKKTSTTASAAATGSTGGQQNLAASAVRTSVSTAGPASTVHTSTKASSAAHGSGSATSSAAIKSSVSAGSAVRVSSGTSISLLCTAVMALLVSPLLVI